MAKPSVPVAYANASTMVIICGIANGFSSLFWLILLISACVGIFWIVPGLISLGVIFVGFQMNTGLKQDHGKSAAIAGIICGFFSTNPIGILFGLLAMQKMDDPEIEPWLRSEDA
jgi:hypothetical protein